MPDYPHDLIDALRKRYGLLETIAAEPATKPRLADAHDVPRSTLDRAIRELEAAGLVARTDDGYDLTPRGRHVFAVHERHVSELRTIDEATPVLRTFPDSGTLPRTVLDGATVVTATEPFFDQPQRAFERFLSSAERLRGYLPYLAPALVDALDDHATDHGLDGELAVPRPVLADAAGRADERWCGLFGPDGPDVLPAADEPEYGLWLLDSPDGRTMGVAGFAEAGTRGLVVNDDGPALDWAARRYEALAATAGSSGPARPGRSAGSTG